MSFEELETHELFFDIMENQAIDRKKRSNNAPLPLEEAIEKLFGDNNE